VLVFGYNYPKNQDKEWLAVDFSDLHTGEIFYLTWTEFDHYGTSSSLCKSRDKISRSTDQGLTWIQLKQ